GQGHDPPRHVVRPMIARASPTTCRLGDGHPGQYVATIGCQAEGLEDQQRRNGKNDNRQQADITHAAAPRLRTRSESCARALWTLLGGSTGSMAWLWRATLVILAIRSINTVPAVT